MNILKKINYLVLALGFVVVFTACEDDFTNEDLVALQESQYADAIAALNNSGQFASAVIQVVGYDNEPVEGATVTITSAAGDTTALGSQSVTTDATGVASFSSIVAGGNHISISSADHIDLLGTANIGSIEYEVLNGNVIPIKTSGSAVIAMTGGGETATITGNVTIQTNVTTLAPERAGGVLVQAGITLNNVSTSGNFNWGQLTFNQESIGTATTDSVGNYTMTVPAPSSSTASYTLIFPRIERDQVVAISTRDGEYLGGLQVDTVTTVFGSGLTGNTAISGYSPFNITVSDPPVQGRGLGLNFTADVSNRTWNPGTAGANELAGLDVVTLTALLQPTAQDNAILRTTSRGSGYIESPSVSITDATGNSKVAEAHIEVAVTGLTTQGTLTGFAADANVVFTMEWNSPFNDTANGDVDTTNNNAATWAAATVPATTLPTITVRSNGSGAIVQDSVTKALNQAIADDDAGFDPDNLFEISDWVDSLIFVNGNAELRVTSATGRVFQIGFQDRTNTAPNTAAVTGYTDPSITFSGGATTNASIDVIQFAHRYFVTTDNSSNTSGYLLLPDNIGYTYFAPSASLNAIGEPTQLSGASHWQIIDSDASSIITNNASTVQAFQVVSSDSTVVARSISGSVRTTVFSVSAPTALIDEREEACAVIAPDRISVDIEKNGQISSISINTADQEYIFNDVQLFFNTGSGYTSAPTITVSTPTGLPGSGFAISVGGDIDAEGEYVIDWSELTITNAGSGYSEFANMITGGTAGATATSVSVRAGETVVFNYDYGIGAKQEDVQ